MSCWCQQAVPAFVRDSGVRCKVKSVYPFSQIEGCHSVSSDYITFTSCLGDVNKLYWHLYRILDSDAKWSQFILSPGLKVTICVFRSKLLHLMSEWFQQAVPAFVRDSGLRCKVKPVYPFSQIEGDTKCFLIIDPSPNVQLMSTSCTGICTGFWSQMQGEVSLSFFPDWRLSFCIIWSYHLHLMSGWCQQAIPAFVQDSGLRMQGHASLWFLQDWK